MKQEKKKPSRKKLERELEKVVKLLLEQNRRIGEFIISVAYEKDRRFGSQVSGLIWRKKDFEGEI